MYRLKKLKTACILAGFCILVASGKDYIYSNASYIQEQQVRGLKTEGKQKRYRYKQNKKKTASFSSIKVNVNSLDIVINPSGDKNFYVSYSLYCANSSNPISYNVKKDVLEIKESKLKWLPFYIKQTDGFSKVKSYRNVIYIYVPSGVSINNCAMDIKDGDLDFGKVSLKDGNIISKSGDIDFSGLALSDKLDIKTGYGDVCIRNTDINGILDIKSESGDIDIYKSDIPGTLGIITDSGDLDASNVNIKGKLVFNTDSGDADTDLLDISGETKINTNSGDIDMNISRKCIDRLNIDMFTDSGDMSVKNLYKGSKKRKRGGYQYKKTGSGRAVLDVYTDYGDISLD